MFYDFSTYAIEMFYETFPDVVLTINPICFPEFSLCTIHWDDSLTPPFFHCRCHEDLAHDSSIASALPFI